MFGDDSHMAWVFFCSAFVSEFLTLLVYYPYDLIKCRLQSRSYKFKYNNLVHAFRKEFKQGGIRGLY